MYEMENKLDKFLTLDFFRNEHEQLETRVKEIVDVKIGNLQENISKFKDQLSETKLEFEHSVSEIRSETSWKIPELEKILDTKISASKV